MMMNMILAFVLAFVVTTTTAATNTSLTVDLGYASYTGVQNASTGLTVWKGIRYAQPPVGRLRWQAPQLLTRNSPADSSTLILADKFGPACPQSLPQVPGASSLFIPGNEDCLFLNVYAPSNTTGAPLPVLVWIHGGGYGEGDATQDLSQMLAATAHSHPMIAVSIQYRLGAFGFLASKEVQQKGHLNAGLLDQRAALEWVRQHIGAFGGGADVTLAGESAGAGSVLLHAVAGAHKVGDPQPRPLFQNIWTASPWIPTQPWFDSPAVERHYADFVVAAGCTSSTDTFACLTTQDTLVLQWASNWVSTNQPTPHGNWAFVPVTDGDLLKGPPSRLLTGGVHGSNALIGNNADEGVLIVPATIRTESDLRAWLEEYFSELDEGDIDSILTAYPPSNTALPPTSYESDGLHPPTANAVSSAATGVQQRAYNIYAEVSVVCPSYWLSTAFSNSTGNKTKTAYHYQYSVPFAAHGADLSAYWGPPTPNQGPDLVQAFREMIAAFVATGNPSNPLAVANGLSSNVAADWPRWSGPDGSHTLVNLNQTGGTPYFVQSPTGVGNVTQYTGPGLQNRFAAEDADVWEGGRGQRCAFWQRLGEKIPE